MAKKYNTTLHVWIGQQSLKQFEDDLTNFWNVSLTMREENIINERTHSINLEEAKRNITTVDNTIYKTTLEMLINMESLDDEFRTKET